ncbi:hypothetical protein ABH920_002293 [Catenulispora sp. EB89]|uniref:hypothetical protein n=1 Tax=Catenulispora sp. EB89 TaxID=3156257 RepID=UPI003515108E
MRKTILPAVGIIMVAASLVGCSSSTTTPGGLGAPPSGGGTHQPAGDDGGRGGSAGTTGATSGSNTDDCITEFALSFCAKVSITGAVTVNGTGNGEPVFGPDDSSLKCADLANYHPTDGIDPSLGVPQSIGDHVLDTNWHYPGGVGTSDISRYAGLNRITIDNKDFMQIAAGSDGGGSSGSVQFNADGSGTLTFKDLMNSDDAANPQKISGTITWTCINGSK